MSNSPPQAPLQRHASTLTENSDDSTSKQSSKYSYDSFQLSISSMNATSIHAQSSLRSKAESTVIPLSSTQRQARQDTRCGKDVYRRQVNLANGKPTVGAETRIPHRSKKAIKGSYISSNAGPAHETLKQRVSFADQLLAVLSRSAQQMWRQKIMVVVDVLLPILFVIVLVILWCAWKEDDMTRPDHYITYNPNGKGLLGHIFYSIVFCYNTTMGKINGLPPCASDNNGICNSIRAGTPFEPGHLCVNSGHKSTANLSFSAITAVYASDMFYGKMAVVPYLDTVIMMQWAAQIGRDALLKLTSPVTSGFIPNNPITAVMASGMLYFTGGDLGLVGSLVSYIDDNSKYFMYVNGGVHESLAAAKAAASKGNMTWAIVELKSATTTDFDLVIHMNNTALPQFDKPYDPSYPGGTEYDNSELYLASGFLTLQQLVSDFYLRYVHDELGKMDHFFAPVDTPPYRRVPLLGIARPIIPLVFALSFILRVTVQCKKIVEGKEQRIREAMLIMGVGQTALYVSEVITQFALVFISSVLCAIILKVTVFGKGDPLIVFCVYILFALTTMPLSALIAAFFSKARLAALVAPVVYFIITVPMLATISSKGSVITGFCVFSPTAFAAGMRVILDHEAARGFFGDDFQNHEDNPTLAVIVGMLTADIFIYAILALYLEAVIPKDWGTRKHPLFFILDPINYCCQRAPQSLGGGTDGCDAAGVYETRDYASDVVELEGLRKEYKRGGKKFLAVNNLYWGMRDSQISVLLGHNGAGKTTVLNMMTGMIEPDQGDCYVYGLSVRTELSKVRKQIGYCPQHNILWPELTCREHLEFFGKIKGLKGWELEDAVCRMLYETDLMDKMDYPSRTLSGGQKRKLSIAMAFVGGSKLVFLDEPSAGLDAGARRYVWELLRRMSEVHTIMLTTHYMDEADLLGHRIGIMSQGRLKCSGSSLFLKSRLGVGYSVTVSVDPEVDASAVEGLVLSGVENASVLTRNGCELTYQLPAASIDQFPELLDALDRVAPRMGIRGYSLTATTLEEVFLKVSDGGGGDAAAEEAADHVDTLGVDISPVWDYDQGPKYCSQCTEMFAKRFMNAVRDPRMLCFQIVCPVVCILIAMLLSLLKSPQPMSLPLDYTMFRDYLNEAPSVIDTSQCHLYFGPAPVVRHAIVNETHFADARELSLYQLDTWYTHRAPRYGAMTCNDVGILTNLTPRFNFSSSNVFTYNTSSKHQAALSLAVFYDLYAKGTKDVNITMRCTAAIITKRKIDNALGLIVIGALIMVPFTFLPSNAVSWVVKEREVGARYLQDIAGLNYLIYWLCNYVFDLCAYFVSMLLCIAVFAMFNKREFIAPDRIGGTFAILVVYGFTSTAAAYAASFAFAEHSNAQTIVMTVGLTTVFVLLVIANLLNLQESTMDVSNTLRYVFRIIPTYCVGEGLLNLLLLDGKLECGLAQGVWDMQVVGWPCVYMAIELPVMIVLTLLLDMPTLKRWVKQRKYNRAAPPMIDPEEDSDVEDEREAVYEASIDEESDVVRVIDLQKRYGNGKLAVKGLTFSIFPGEVFGFLGTNGAGKTTTISMMCQQQIPTGGSACICGSDIIEDSRDALRCIGYCPQFDATLELLTVEEHIKLYMGIRGVHRESRGAVLSALLQLCQLTTYRHTLSGRLSGGNRRKLSVAISLVGGPQVVFLDEPSAGMDPGARRGMWTTIQKAATHCSVVLTTHHLEEVEVLADIVAIMVDGSLRCIGDKIHLKNKYGSGFEVSLRIDDAEHACALEAFFMKSFPEAKLCEQREWRYIYQLPRTVKFGNIFRTIQQNKQQLHITDYSVSQTSIEQIFLRVSEEGVKNVTSRH